MKIRDLIESEESQRNEFIDWIRDIDNGLDIAKWKNGRVVAGLEVSKKSIELTAKFKPGKRFDPPSFVKSNDWQDFAKILIEKFYINDFSNIPNVPKLELLDCQIDSLKGIEKLDKVEYLILTSDMDFGILRLLKMPKLDVLVLADVPSEVKDIVFNHLKGDRSVVDCQSELIDAGYDDWAKL